MLRWSRVLGHSSENSVLGRAPLTSSCWPACEFGIWLHTVLPGLTEVREGGTSKGQTSSWKLWFDSPKLSFQGLLCPSQALALSSKKSLHAVLLTESHHMQGSPRARCELTCWKPLQQLHRATIPDLLDKAPLSPQNPSPHTFLYLNRKTHLGWQVYEFLTTAQWIPSPSPGLKF